MAEILLLIMVVVAIVVVVILIDTRCEHEETNHLLRKIMSQQAQIIDNLTASEAALTAGVEVIIGLNRTVQTIADDVLALKQAIQSGSLDAISTLADSIQLKAANMAAALGTLSTGLAAVDEAADLPVAEEPAEEPGGGEETPAEPPVETPAGEPDGESQG